MVSKWRKKVFTFIHDEKKNKKNLCHSYIHISVLQKRGRKNPVPNRRLTATEEMDKLQKSTDLLLPRAPFRRLVRAIVLDCNPQLFIQNQTFEALQESAEMYIVQTFEDALLLTQHRHCITVELRDMRLAQQIKSNTSNQR